MAWVLKSESDTDEVWVEVDGAGNETGKYEYRWADGTTTNGVAGGGRSRRWPWAVAAGSVGLAVGAASRLLPW